ncbi:MAG: TetR/AcrR family transcriptional regulator [Solirubrobacteraceae bacterium]
MALTRTPRAAWIDAGLRALAAGGPDAVRIESLAAALGVTKGGFYGQFDDRRALLEEMLDTWERVMIDEVIERVEGEGGDGTAKLRRLFALRSGSVLSGKTRVSTRELLKIDLAIRDWARRDNAVAKRLRRVDNRRLEYMRSLFRALCTDDDEVEVRCLLALSLLVGSPLIAADHGRRSRREVQELALKRLLAS